MNRKQVLIAIDEIQNHLIEAQALMSGLIQDIEDRWNDEVTEN